MIPSKRRNELLALIREDGYASVAYLAGKLHVSQSTIRRDLDELALSGHIARTHGGVESLDELLLPIDSRYLKNKPQKTELARHAAALVDGARLIFVDNSSTASYLVSFLPKGELTIFTNGADSARIFAKAGIRTISTGGELLAKSSAYVGGYTLELLSGVRFDAAFFSSSAIDGECVSDWSEQETIVRRRVIAQSKRSCFLCDTSKLGLRSEYTVCKIDALSRIVTEDGSFTPDELRARYKLPNNQSV